MVLNTSHPMIRLRKFIIVGLVLLANTVFGADAQPLDHVTLQLKWKHQFQFAGYYAAVAQGYYKQAGLDVKLVEGSPDHDPTEEVLAGHADFGVGNSDLLLFRYKGKPVVVLASIFQHSPLILVARAAGGAKDLQALHDKKLMMIPSESAEIFAYFKHEGIDPSKLNVRPHTFNIEDFISGNVDAMSAYSTDEPFKLKQRGFDFYTFVPRAGGIDFYGDCLFTTEQQIHDNPDRVRAFREASLKGWQYAMEHQAEVVDLIMANYNTQNNSREQYLFEAQQTAELMHPDLIEVGYTNPGRWRHMADTYAEFGMLPQEFDLSGLLYDPYPKPNYARFYWPLAIVSLIAVAALVWLWPLYRLNVQLRRAKESAEAANEAKSRYLAVITHEVRTPLSGIISLMGLLKEEPLAADQQEMLNLVQTTGEEMLRLVNDVLEFSKIEEGHLQLELTTVDVAPFLDEIQQLFQSLAREKSLDFQVSFSPKAPRVILTDVLRLKGILRNLLSNAIKFTQQGAVTLEVSAQPEPTTSAANGPRWRWSFVVRDTGMGIAPEQRAGLFQPYGQVDAGIARRFGGTGLGLAISHQLAKLLDGELKLKESTVGKGSTFVLEIVTGETLPPEKAATR